MNVHANRDQASAAAAAALADAVTGAIARQRHPDATAALALSGGTTPVACLDQLRAMALPWPRIQVLPTDERCVPVSDPASNEGMIRRQLQQGAAAAVRVVPLDTAGPVPVPLPFAATLVGMGEDGHFASLFPDAANLDQALDPDAPPACLPVHTAASPHPRLSLNLAALIHAERMVLLAFGDAKRRILDDPRGLPVDALLRQTRVPVAVMWAP